MTLHEAAEAYIAGMRDGSVRSRKGEGYKPSAIRGYERTLRLRVLPRLGAMRLSEIERRHVQALADSLVAEGLAPASVLNYLDPLRAIFRRALQREEVASTRQPGSISRDRARAGTGSLLRRRRLR